MRPIITIALSCIIVLASSGFACAQVAGSSTVGVTVEELKEVALGWSAKKQILGQGVYNALGATITDGRNRLERWSQLGNVHPGACDATPT